MKLGKLTLGIIASTVIFTVSTFAANTTVKEESLGLRKTSVYTEDKITGDKTQYGTDAAGSSKRFDRAFENAPPMIPHDVEGLLEITPDNNACIGCHEAAVAPTMNATPIPPSHYTNFRPKAKLEGDNFVKGADDMKNETSIKRMETISSARFNCTACHAPQSTGELAVENTFKPTFTRKDGKAHSTWDEVLTDDLDTLKKK